MLGALVHFALELPATAEVQRNDFEAYWSAGRLVHEGQTERLYVADHKWFTNLPVVAWALAPLGALEYRRAWRVFWVLQLASFVATLGVVWLLIARHFGPLSLLRAAGALAVLLCFAPVLRRCLTLGQSTPLVVLVLALCHLALREGWRKLGGALLGLACLIKIPPLLLVAGLAARRRLDVAAAALGVVAAGVALSFFAFGPELVAQYADRVILDNLGEAQAAFNNRSLDGAYMRIFTTRSLVDWDTLPRPPLVTGAVLITLLGLLGWLWWRGGRVLVWPATRPGPEPLELELAIGTAFALLAFPVVWIHYYLLLAAPLAVLPFWWWARGLPLAPLTAVLLGAGLWLASGSEVHGNHIYGRYQHELGFRWLQNLQPLGAVLLLVGLGAPLAAWASRTRGEAERTPGGTEGWSRRVPAATPGRIALLAALVGALVAAHLLATSWLTPHGHVSVDECTYHLMARSASQGTLAFWNGYDELPTPELAWVTLVPHAGQLYPVTPPIYAAIAWPFYAALGLSGLFWLNALAFLAVLGLTARLAQQLFGDARLSLVAVGVLAAATYLWEYSQAVWPHVLSTLAVLGAVSAGWAALRADRETAAWRASALAGLLLGLGMGVRLDVALALPAVALPFLFAGGRRARAGLGVVLGCLPPLLLLTFINHLKFGIASPFSYGPHASPAGDWVRYLPVAALGLAGVLAGWALERPGSRAWLREHRLRVALAGGAALLVALALPELRDLLLRLTRGVATLLLDLRALREDIVRPALSRSAGDGLVYFGHLKKAWVQSLPYLGLLVLPAAAVLCGHAERGRLALLALLPASYLAAFGAFASDGGMSLNLRYLAPALPAVAILTAWALRDLGARRGPAALGIGAWCGAALFVVLSRMRSGTPDEMELFVLDAPLVLAGLLVLTLGVLVARDTEGLRSLARALAAAALVWASLVAFAYDYPAVRWLRGYNAELSRAAARVVEPDSLFLTTHPDPFCGLLDADRVRIGLPSRDQYRDFRRLTDLHLEAGRPVYAALPRNAWQMLARSKRLAGLEVEVLYEHPVFSIARLRE